MVHIGIKNQRTCKQEGIRNAGIGNRHKSVYNVVDSQIMHVAINIGSRYASVSIIADETADSVIQHLLNTYRDCWIMLRMSEVASFLVVSACIWPNIGGRS